MQVWKIAAISLGALAGVSVAALGGALYWVQNSDLSGVAAWAVEKQGYGVEFDGPVTLKLWPAGHLATGKVVVKGADGKPMVSTDEAQLQWNWGSGALPWKDIQITRIAAANPTVTLVRTKDGNANWDTYVASEDKMAAEATEVPVEQAQQLPLGMLAATQLDIVNLNARYEDAVSGQKVVAKNVNLNASTEGTEATTTLNGTVNDQDVKGRVVVDVADLETIPLQGKLEAAGLKVAMNGRVRNQQAFAGLVNAETDNLKATLAALMGKAPEQAPAAAFRLGGDVDVGGEKLVLRNFSTRLGELLQANGDVEVNLGDTPSAKGDITVQGSNLRQLAELALGAEQPTIPASSFEVFTKLAGQDAVELEDLQASIGSLLRASGKVRIVPKDGMPDVDATLSMTAPNFKNLLNAVGQSGEYPSKALAVKTTVKGRGETYEVKGLTAQLDEIADMKADTTVTLGETPAVNGAFTVEGANLRTAAAGFGVAAEALPETAFNIKAAVSGKGTLKIDDLAVNLPQLLEATGKGSVTLGTPTNVVATLDVTRMNLTALGYCAVDVPTETAAPSKDAPSASNSDAPWSDEVINVDALRGVAFDITVNAKGIDCKRLPMESAVVKLFNTPSQLDVRDVSVNLKDGGTLKLTGKLEHAGTPALVVNATTTKLRVEQLVPVLASKGVELPLDTTAQFNSRGDTTRKLAQNLDGTLNVTADEGKLPYTNLMGAASNIAKLVQGTSATAPSNGSGNVDSLKARYTIRQGVATTDELTVATGNGAMKLVGEGTVDLPAWVINYKLTPSLNAGDDMLAVPVVVKGPLTAPSIGADPNFTAKVTGRLAGQALEGALGKEAGKAVGGALGGIISGQGITSSTVGDLINAFGKKKAAPAAEAAPAETPAAE